MRRHRNKLKPQNPYTASIAGGGGTLKALSSALFAGCLIFAGQASYAVDDPVPTLDTLHDSLVNIPDTDEVYPSSAYSFEEITPSNPDNLGPNVIKYKGQGNTEAKYYEVNLKYSVYGEGNSTKYFKWAKDSNGICLVETTNQNEAVLTLMYNPEDKIAPIFQESGDTLSAVNKIYIAQDIQKAIDVKTTITSVSSTFAGNTIDITGTNYDYSAVMTENNGTISNVNSSFIGNTVTVDSSRTTAVYGTLLKSLGTIDNVYSEFVGNSVSASNARINGGLIEAPQAGTIGNLTVDAILNKVTTDSSNLEGAIIGNSGTITNINGGMYLNNSGSSNSGNVYGGVIYNDGLIGSISNTVFSGNSAKSETGSAQGGALYNIRDIESITNTIFTDNYAQGAFAQGGAIYTDADLKIYANDGKRTEFTNNYVINNGTKENQAIFINDKNATLTLGATDSGTILLNDAINGTSGYSVVLTGDETGTISLYNNIYNANVSAANVNIDLSDGNLYGYNFLSLDSSDTAKYSLDIDFANAKSDTFTLGSASRGTIYINDLNILGNTPTTNKIVQIITGPDTISLALSDALLKERVTEVSRNTVYETITATTTWDKEFISHTYANTITEGVRTAITGAGRTTADSIEYYYVDETKEVASESMGDTLGLINRNLRGQRQFNAVKAEDVYTVTENLGKTGSVYSGGWNNNYWFRVTGKKDGDVISTLDANGKTLFEYDDTTNRLNLLLENLNIINLAEADGALINNQSPTGYFRLSGVNISGGEGYNGIINNGTLSIYSGTITSPTGIKGTGNLVLEGTGNLTMTNGASIEQGLTTINNGRILTLEEGSSISGSINIVGGGNLYTRAEGLLGDFTALNGTLTLTGGTLTKAIDFTTGLTRINGDVIFKAPVSNGIRLVSNSTLTTDGSFLCNIVDRDGVNTSSTTLNITGGTVKYNINNMTEVNILGDVVFDGMKNSSLMNIKEGASLTANADCLKNSIVNDSILEMTGGTYDGWNGNSRISGSGQTIISGDVTISRQVSQNMHILDGASLTMNSDNIKSDVVNDGIFKSTGGDMNYNITGTGTINIINNVTLWHKPIVQAVVIDSGARLRVDNVSLLQTDTITNNGYLVLHGSSGEINVQIKGNGLLYLDLNSKTLNTYTENRIQTNNATLWTNADNLGAEVINNANTVLTGGTLKHQIAGSSKGSGWVGIYYDDVISEALISNNVLQLENNGNLTIDANNIDITNHVLVNAGSNLNLLGGADGTSSTISSIITGGGTTNIWGDITVDRLFETNVVIAGDDEHTGTLRSNLSIFASNKNITNYGNFYASGLLAKTIYGTGTTFIDEELGITKNAIIQGTLNLNGGVLTTDGAIINNYNLGTATGTGKLGFNIDFAQKGAKNDTLTLTSASDAIFTVSTDTINFINIPPEGLTDTVFQVLLGGSNAQLALGDNTELGLNVVKENIDVLSHADVYYDKEFVRRYQEGVITGTLSLATTQTTNDSVKLNIGETIWEDPEIERADLLAAWNKLSTPEERFFRFREADNVYTGLEDLGATSSGTLNIIGVVDEETGNRSKIDLNGHTGFELSTNRILNIYDTEISNATDHVITMNGGSIGFLDADGNVQGGIIGAVFKDNTKLSEGSANLAGGAVLNAVNNANIYQIKDSQFINNSSSKINTDVNYSPNGEAGALYLNSSIIGTKDTNLGGIINTVFQGNHLTGSNTYTGQAWGGAISLAGNNVYISNIIDSTFKGNYVEGFANHINGGAIQFSASTIIHNIENTLFEGNYLYKDEGVGGNLQGGAIYNNGTIDRIYNVTFKGNYVSKEGATGGLNGGAIYNSKTISEIDNCIFEDNSAGAGGAILGNLNGTSITSTTFRNNSGTLDVGGALYISGGTLKSIKDCIFEGNSSKAGGGAIYMNNSTITEISGSQFLNNKSGNEIGDSSGGVIWLVNASIGSITDSRFIGNSVSSGKNQARGSIIIVLSNSTNTRIGTLSNLYFENNSSTGYSNVAGCITTSEQNNSISEISNLTFIGNSAVTLATSNFYTNGAGINNAGTIGIMSNIFAENNYIKGANATGAVISNQGTITNGIVNSVFKNNYVIKYTTLPTGAAISSSKDLTVSAQGEDGLTEFTGNYVMKNGDENSKTYQAIYMSTASSTLTLDANTGGRILLNDGIYGANGYSVVLTGDELSTISLYNNITNGSVSAKLVNIDTADSNLFDYDFVSLTSEDTAGYSIDIDFKNSAADTFTVGENSSGVMLIKNLNILNEAEKATTVQVIKAPDSSLQLALDSGQLNVVENLLLTLNDRVYNTDIYHQQKGFALGSTDTINDSITMLVDEIYDTLNIIGASTVNTDRQFIFNNDETYSVSADLDNLAAGVLAIKGLDGDSTTSTIDASGHSLFNLTNETELQVTNTMLTDSTAPELKNLITVSNDAASVNLKNAYIDGNITGDVQYSININGAGPTVITGTVDHADTTLSSGILSFAENTFADSNDTLTINNGSVALKDSETKNYQINKLVSSQDASYTIDLDFNSQQADKITLADTSSEGVITISEINIVNDLINKENFVVQVLDSNSNDNISLELDKFVKTRYDIEEISREEQDVVTEITHFTDTFNNYERKGTLYGSLYLTTTSTNNDSLAFEILEDWENSAEFLSSCGDTLKLVNIAQLDNKIFVSEQATDVYNATDDLGQTAAGVFTINGTAEGDEKSTINLRNHTGFELGADTTLNINNTQISGNNGVIYVTDSSAEINLNNATIYGDITGTQDYHLNVAGTGTTNLSGMVENGYTTLSKGGLSFDKDTFAHEGSTLDVQAGSVYLNDGNIQNYNIANMVSTDKSKFSIDVDLENCVADTLTVASGQGTIVLEEFNITGGLTNVDINDDYTIQILKTPTDNIQLDLSETVWSQINDDIKLGTDHIILDTDEIMPATLWNDKYWVTEQDLDIWGRLGLSSKETTNDSLHLYHLSIVAGETKRVLGDTLKLWSQAEIDENRTFTFETADDRYTVSEYPGTTSAGNLEIIGVSGVDDDGNDKLSIIDMNRKTGFGLANDTELTINNVEFQNISYKDGCVINVSNQNAILNLNNVSILDTTCGNAIANAGTINMTGGNVLLATGIIGSGITNIEGSDVVLGDNISITQQNINVNSGSLTMADTGIVNGKLSIGDAGTASVRTESLISSVNNDGNIILRGGNLIQNITGDGETTITGDVVNSAKIAQNVDIQNGKLTSSAEKLGGEINNNGELIIDGELSKYITGDGTTYVNELLKMNKGSGMSGTLDLNDGDISTKDNSVADYNIGSMLGNGSFSIDVDCQNNTADKFIVGNNSDGTVYIDSINFLNIDGIDESFKVQILDTDGTDAIQLALNSEISNVDYKVKRTVRAEFDDVNAVTKYSDLYNTYLRGGDVFGNIVLGTTDTTNDSLVVTLDYSKTKWDETREKDGLLGDTLTLWNQLDDENDKKFYFDDVKTYTVGAESETTGLGTTRGSKVSITGVSSDETTKSTIDLNNKTGFELSESTKFTVSDVKLTGNQTLINVTNNDASITLQNAYIDGNVTGTESYNVEISGSDVTTLNGIFDNANAELKSGTLKFNTDTFKAENDTLKTTAGNVALNDGQTQDYIINTLNSNADANYFIDINLTDKSADTLHVANGNGIVTLDKLNISGVADIAENQDYKIRILYVDSDALQLALSENAQTELGKDEYLIGQNQSIIDDQIKAVTNWQDIYNRYSQDHFTYGELSLAQTYTTNDSIGIHVTRIEDGELTLMESLGDTLRLVNNDETNDSKTFEFDSSSDEYKVQENLGETKGIVNIEGVSDGEKSSIINFDNHSGFELNEDSQLNISNTELSNAHGEKGSVIYAPVPGKEVNLTNVSITNNTSDDENGGAIYSHTDVTLNADKGVSIVSGNSSASSDEAIYMGENATLTLNSTNDGSIIIDDKINGESGYKVHITGDDSSDVYLNNKVENAIVEMDKTTLHLSSDNNLESSNVVINSGRLDLVNNSAQQQIADSFYVNGTFKLDVDVDLSNEVMDRLPENTQINPDAFIQVDKINLLSDTKSPSVTIPFAYKQFKDNVEYIGAKELSKDTQVTTAFAPIFKYSLKYESRDDLGYFVFTRGAGADPSTSDAFNPSVLAAPVASQAGAFVAMNQSLDYAFEHSDAYMLLPSDKRFLLSNSGRYAINSGEVLRNQPGDFINNAIWVNSYASFESISLKNGPKVSTTSYGTLVGGDSELKYLSHGWQTASTVYAGYNGSSQHFSGVSTYQNGGLLGVTQTFYKNNFFTALTASAGAAVGEASTMYGHENFTSLMAGVASKSGYNLELKDGKYIIQPSMLMSYTFINTFDYTNAAGVRIDSDPLNTIQLHPDIKFAANLKNGWQPYAKVGMVWNLINDTKFTANDVRLPELSVKPYVEYGVGIQKRCADKFSGYLQAMIRNGGRNGIALTAGFRWSLGTEGKPLEHCQNIQNVAVKGKCNRNNLASGTGVVQNRKIIKQLSDKSPIAVKRVINQNSNKTTQTSSKGIIKML